MAKESMNDLVKRVVSEICSKKPELNIQRPFNVVLYDPQGQRMNGVMKSEEGLARAVRTFFEQLEKEPTYVGEILFYVPVKTVVYQKQQNK